MNYIIAIGAFQSLLLLLVLLFNKKRKSVDFLIRALLACIFIHLSIKFIIYTYPGATVFQKGFNTFIDMAYGPLLWVIARKVKDVNYLPERHWYFFLPTFIAAFFYFGIILFTMATGEAPAEIIDQYNTITTYLIVPILLIFSIAAYKISARLLNFWETERRLIRDICALFLLMSGLVIVTFVLGFFTSVNLSSSGYVRSAFYALLVVVCVAIMRYFMVAQAEIDVAADEEPAVVGAIRQFNHQRLQVAVAPEPHSVKKTEEKNLLSGRPNTTNHELDFFHVINQTNVDEINTQERNLSQKTSLSPEQHLAIIESLERLMTVKKIYTDPDLDLEKLSELSKISRHHISETLNRHAVKTFYVFVNEYRIREVLSMLDTCRKNNVRPHLLSLAFGAGFNSKSSFNLYFKRTTGLTPSEYLKAGNTCIEPQKISRNEKVFTSAGKNW